MKKIILYFFILLAIIVVLPNGIIILTYILSNNKKVFADMTDFTKNRPVEYNRFPLPDAVALIPKSATEIEVSYRSNRRKNILIHFKLNHSLQKDFIKITESQLHEYKNKYPNDNRMISISFEPKWKGSYVSFQQIDFNFSGDLVEIQTF
jgi:hypothetical protein